MKIHDDALCIKNWSITADNGDHFEVKRGNFYTTSVPEKDHVVVLSNFWVSVPASVFSFKELTNMDD